jgi:NAD(P)-dependent dehydrogenase (short-subunit alcohol dehydrogenase family)
LPFLQSGKVTDSLNAYQLAKRANSLRRAGTPDEVANVAALLMGRERSFITGSDFLMDGGVTAAY